MSEKFHTQINSKPSMVYMTLSISFGTQYHWNTEPSASTQISVEIPADMFDKGKFGQMVEGRIKELADAYAVEVQRYQEAQEAGELEEE